jgi:hypothetical protein
VQSENEYTGFASGHSEDFNYENLLKTALRNAGVKVPLSFNDANPSGHYTSVDLWGYDLYPNGFDCSKTSWGSGAVPTYLWDADRKYAPSGVPNNIYEFQGGKSFFIFHLSLHIRSLILCRCVRWLGRSFLRYVCSKSHYF